MLEKYLKGDQKVILDVLVNTLSDVSPTKRLDNDTYRRHLAVVVSPQWPLRLSSRLRRLITLLSPNPAGKTLAWYTLCYK